VGSYFPTTTNKTEAETTTMMMAMYLWGGMIGYKDHDNNDGDDEIGL